MKYSLTILVSLLLIGFSSLSLANDSWQAHCKAKNELHEVQSRGQCQALFKLNEEGDGLKYKLIASNIEFVTQAHIHLAPPDQNGGVVAFLFGFVPEGVNPNGTLAQGVITADDLVGSLAGMTLEDLLAELDAGNAYVNVHTQEYPAGEVRGQIK
jgi:hypothetical protein